VTSNGSRQKSETADPNLSMWEKWETSLAPDVPQSPLPDVYNEAETEPNSSNSHNEGWRNLGMSWFATPKLKEGLLKSKASLEKGMASVTAFTSTETKLLMSQAKRKIYCPSGKNEDLELTAILKSVDTCKMALENQRSCIRKVINSQRLLEENQKLLCQALKQVTDDNECSKKSSELAAVVESRVQMLVPTDKLQELADQIEKLLSTDYAEILKMRKSFQTAKNEADVQLAKMARMETKGTVAELKRMNNDFLQATDEYILSKNKMKDLWAKLLENQDKILCPILLKATGLEGLEEVLDTAPLDENTDLRGVEVLGRGDE